MNQTGLYSYIVKVNGTPKRKLRPRFNQPNQAEQNQKFDEDLEKRFMTCVSTALQDEYSAKENISQPLNMDRQANDDIVQEEQEIFPKPKTNCSFL